ncbi:MAG TPA: ACT domain-containing protein [Burkholderiales bacterium]|nr:ACT domain-containing protein [Burkholderiales bacterium]
MADVVRKVDYFSMAVSDKAGQGVNLLDALAEAEVNLLAFTGFPRGRKAQVDFIPEDARKFTSVAKKAGWEFNPKKTGFLVQGDDRPGALAELLRPLAEAGVNVTAMDAVVAGEGRYGAILWVKPEDVTKASKLLGVKRAAPTAASQ